MVKWILARKNLLVKNNCFYILKTEGQTTQWSKDRRTDNTMVKRQKDRQHDGQKKKDKKSNNYLQNTTQKTIDRSTRTTQKPGVNPGASEGHCVVCPSVFWPLCCLSFCLLTIVLSVLRCMLASDYLFGISKLFLDTIYFLKQKNKQLFTKHYTENYRPINTNHTKTGGEPWCFGRKSSSCSTSGTCIVLSVLLSFDHCVVCPSVFWPLCCLSFDVCWLLITSLVSPNFS
jgi:hypothetical protein